MDKIRILVVDDESNNQRILAYTLNKAGFEVVAVPNGEVALGIMQESAFDLAILDIAMPVMDGLTLLSRIRSIPHYSGLPVIVITGSDEDSQRVSAEALGIQGFLTKPASSRTVIETVKQVLDRHAKN